MAGISKDDVLNALRRVNVPGGGGIVALGLVSDIVASDGKVIFSISVPAERAREMESVRQAAEAAVKAVPGVEQVMVALTAERRPGSAPTGSPGPPPTKAASHPPHAGPPPKAGVPGVGAIIAVASGKGGVGKSTVAVNLALGLQALGRKVGILDADIYGPSMPRLLGMKGRPEPLGGRMLKPLERYRLKVMSIGFLVEEDTPMIWRGPMVQSALVQMLREVAWGELDVLVVDMPPGTGDAQLTLAQQVPLAGAVIVSTPQDLALIDARKGLAMFQRVDVPVLGLVENMSYFVCPHCGERSDIFGHGGAEQEAARIGVPFLGNVPLHMKIREYSDAGTPVVAREPESEHAKIFREIAGRAWARVEAERATTTRQPPKIVME